jgi:hypothetical protein
MIGREEESQLLILADMYLVLPFHRGLDIAHVAAKENQGQQTKGGHLPV